MVKWYDELVKQVKGTVEVQPVSKNFYDVIRAIYDEEIQSRIYYYNNLNDSFKRQENLENLASKGDYDWHNMLCSMPYLLLRSESDKHSVRMDELEDEWEEECSRECDYDDYEEKLQEAIDNSYRSRSSRVGVENFEVRCRFKLHCKTKPFTSQYYTEQVHWMSITVANGSVSTILVNTIKEKKYDWFKHSYTIRDDSGSGRYETPSHIMKHRGALYGARFGYTERESIFNEPTVKFNKEGEPMATAKALDVINDILKKNGATTSSVKKKENTKDARLKNIVSLRGKWTKQILVMKSEFDSTGKAKGISYEKNATKLDDSYFDVEFISQRQHLGLKGGKGTFKLSSKHNVSAFLQDIVDAISVHAFDAQLLSHQRKVEKAKKVSKANKVSKGVK